MSKKVQKKRHFWQTAGSVLAYLTAFLMFIGIAKVGSDEKVAASNTTIDMNAIAESDFNVSADQLSELYVVANLSSSFDLASVDTVSSNYVTISVMKEIGQIGTDKIEKPSLVNTNLSTGVETHIVAEGETLASIAQYYNKKHKLRLTTDQLRWSNGLKTEEISVGQALSIPMTSGIVYTVKNGESLESIAERMGSSIERIIAQNDLEGRSIAEGMKIVLPGGTLPETERPEYVAPVRRRPTTFTYSYYGSASGREGMRVVADGPPRGYSNKFTPGQCTWYAAWWRATDPRSQGPLVWGVHVNGHAKYWASSARAAGLRVDRHPEVGAVFQTTSGYYGHVGVVLAVNSDGSILVREMNYGYKTYVVTESTIPANTAGNFMYIH